jgi:hypothetical protein
MLSGMKRIAKQNRSIRLLRWVFQRGNQLLTCQLDSEGSKPSYTLSLVPHWDVRQAVSETFDAGVSAFHRHANVAERLRREGWTAALDRELTNTSTAPSSAPAPHTPSPHRS